MRKEALVTGLFAFLGALANDTSAQGRLPVIGMHLHSYDEKTYAAFPDQFGEMAPPSVEAHFNATYDSLRRQNIVPGVVSGSVASEEAWIENDKDGRLLRGFSSSNLSDVTPEAFEALVKDGNVDVFGEIGAFYQGKTLADPLYDPYLKICEKYGIPVAIHTGGGPPMTTDFAPEARLVPGNPLLIEDVPVRYPNLKIYMMHSGVAWFREALQLMLSHPHVYTDLGLVLWAHPAPMFYGREFLIRAKEFGMLDRVMFGSDQMMWPHGIDASIERLESFDFLTEEEKRDILYNNAALFLGLSEEQITEHHRR